METVNEKTIIALREEVSTLISGKRLSHTFSVENEAAKLGELFGFDDKGIFELRIAGLLHDITKEKTTEEQLILCNGFGIPVSDDDIKSPKVFHEMTGAALARKLHPELVSDRIFDGIRYHTTGRVNMSLFDKIIYLADYIEPTRTFEDCVKLRQIFYSAKIIDQAHLDSVLLISFDMTISDLIREKKHIHPETIKARNCLLGKIN